jgi:deazaflavin-dependent oxidoreductase (nitroreductase family)
VSDFNQGVIDEFGANRGVVGGGFAGTPMVLLTTTGARSGKTRVNPLAVLVEGDGLYVFASKGGADTDPDWFRNLLAHPEVGVEFGDDRFDAVAVPVTGAERDRLFAAQAALLPAFAEYETKTARVIPVVELRRRT